MTLFPLLKNACQHAFNSKKCAHSAMLRQNSFRAILNIYIPHIGTHTITHKHRQRNRFTHTHILTLRKTQMITYSHIHVHTHIYIIHVHTNMQTYTDPHTNFTHTKKIKIFKTHLLIPLIYLTSPTVCNLEAQWCSIYTHAKHLWKSVNSIYIFHLVLEDEEDITTTMI